MQVKVVNVVLWVCRCYHLLSSWNLDVDGGVYWGECTVSPVCALVLVGMKFL